MGHLVLRHGIGAQSDDVNIINIAGRQRMLTQLISKDVLLIERGGLSGTTALADLRSALRAFEEAQWKLEGGAYAAKRSPTLIGMYRRLQPELRSFVTTAHTIVNEAASMPVGQLAQGIDTLVASGGSIVSQMDTIVGQYAAESRERVIQTTVIANGLLLSTLSVLAIEGWLIFHPIVRRVMRSEFQLRTYAAELQNANRLLTELATIDSLTGVKNRRAFVEAFDAALASSRRYGHPCSLVLLDVDEFKAFNDAFGHLAGDTVLRRVAEILGAQIRISDCVARYDGEEFAIILPNTDRARSS